MKRLFVLALQPVAVGSGLNKRLIASFNPEPTATDYSANARKLKKDYLLVRLSSAKRNGLPPTKSVLLIVGHQFRST